MGLKILFSIVWLSVCGLPRFGDCNPKWDKINNNNKPYDGTKVYAKQDASFTFDWRYTKGGYSMEYGKWSFVRSDNKNNNKVIIASQLKGLSANPSGSYDGRILFSSDTSARMEIKKLKYPADQGKYECDLTFKKSKDYKYLVDTAELIVVVPPKIISKSNSPFEVDQGRVATLKCGASGNPLARIIWRKKKLDKNEYITLSDSYNHYGYNITYAGRKDIGLYTCDAIVTGGSIRETESYQVTVNIKYRPEVTYLTQNRTLTEGKNVDLKCTAVGDPPVTGYFWYKNQAKDPIKSSIGKYAISESSGSSQLTIKSLNRNDADWYYCAAKNDRGLGNRTGVYVAAIYAPTKVEIKHIPKATINISQPVTLRCESDGVPQSTFQWTFKDDPLKTSVQVIHGSSNEEVRIAKMTRELSGEYKCTASNGHGSSSTTDILHVNYKPEKAYFDTGLPDLGAIQHSRTKLTCKSDGYPTPKFIIKKYDGNSLVTTYKDRDHILFNPVQLDDEKYTYTCTPINFLGQGPETPKSRLLVIVGPSFQISLKPSPVVTRTENETMNYTCAVDAKPAAEIVWYIGIDNVTVEKPYLGRVVTVSEASKNNVKQFRTTSTLVLDPVTWRHNGNISCIASNDAGPTQTYTILEVKHRPVVKNAKNIPSNQTVLNGADVTFTCQAIGNPPTDSYRWRFNGRDIPDEKSQTLKKQRVSSDDVGKYSCLGINSLGEGPWFTVDLFIKTKARVIFNGDVTANVTGHATLVCQAAGIPKPVIYWYRGNSKVLATGEKLHLYNLTYEDRGKYLCVAENELYKDKADVNLIIRVKPNITSNKPNYTQVAGKVEGSSSLVCIVLAVPNAEIWWTRENEAKKLQPSDDRVLSINVAEFSQTLRIKVKNVGEDYYCHARNIMGYAKQKYTIREHGRPDRPIDLIARTIKVSGKRIVNVNISWTAGYSGGEQQFFTIRYKLFTAEDFTEIDPNADTTEYIITDLKPRTKYSFQIVPRNTKGQGKSSEIIHYTTEASDVPPARGTVKITRIEDGTKFQITWTMDKNVTATYLQYREVTYKSSNRARRNVDDYEYGRWIDVVGAQGLSRNTTSFVVVNLQADKTYQFRILFKVANEIGFNNKMMVQSEIIIPLIKPEGRTGLKSEELIAIIAACGGVLLILILVLCLCCFVRRKKGYGADSVQMSQTGSVPNLMSSYGDLGARGTNRRSYATESVEDDPFIDAFVANEMKKKRKPENGINHGYASQESFPRRQEILLNPGSRSGMRGGMSHSVGQLDGRTSSYSSNGPQKDFSTLPPYHEPPSFEEAIRQSVKKSKHAALSTGDLTEEPGVRNGRSRARTPDSDTSDSEPPLNRRPMFKVKPIDPANDKRYRSAPSLPPLNSPVRRGPRDPSSLYARPHKKVPYTETGDVFGSPPWGYIDHNYPTKASPSGWPPPSYSAEDRALLPDMDDGYEPRVTNRRPISGDVLELHEQPSYHRNDRLPDLPPSMPEFNRGRGSLHKEPLGETLPEPPSFLRDLSYDDDEPDGRYQRSFTEPRNRQKQPYVNIHGQLVRPSSPVRQPPHGTDHQEPIYANGPSRLVAAEPEVPVERRGRQSSSNEEHKPGYVSSGFLV